MSKPRIETAEELDALPDLSVVQSLHLPKRPRGGLDIKAPPRMRGWAWTKLDGCWHGPDGEAFYSTDSAKILAFLGPLTVLYRPDAPEAPVQPDPLRAGVEALADDMDERGRPGASDSAIDTASRRQIREDVRRLRGVLAATEVPRG